MLAKVVVAVLLVVVNITSGQVVGAVNRGGCMCQAVDVDMTAVIVKDFGLVKHCTGLGDCNCNRNGEGGMQTCRSVCEHVVATWALNNCPERLRGREVRSQFQSPTCPNALGVQNIDCGVRQCLCPCQAAFMAAPVMAAPMVQMVGGGGGGGGMGILDN